MLDKITKTNWRLNYSCKLKSQVKHANELTSFTKDFASNFGLIWNGIPSIPIIKINNDVISFAKTLTLLSGTFDLGKLIMEIFHGPLSGNTKATFHIQFISP